MLASNNNAAFVELQCGSRVSFESLCQTNPAIVANFDEDLCASMSKDSNLAIVIPVVIGGMLIFTVVAMYLYGELKKKQADSLWQISEEELKFRDPAAVIGKYIPNIHWGSLLKL